MVFCKERRAALKDEHPELQFGKLGARLGEMWRTMSAEEKRPYEVRAATDRERYKGAMGSYQSANMLKGPAGMMGGGEDPYAQLQGGVGVMGGGGGMPLGMGPGGPMGPVGKKARLDDGSEYAAGGGGMGGLDPAQMEMLQAQQQQFLVHQLQQQFVAQQMAAAGMAAAAGAAGTAGGVQGGPVEYAAGGGVSGGGGAGGDAQGQGAGLEADKEKKPDGQ